MKRSSLRTCMEIIEHYRRRMDAHDAYPVCQSVDMDDVRNIARVQRQGTDEEKADFREVMERYFQHIQPADAAKLLAALLGDEDNGYIGHKNDAKLFNALAERLPNLRGEGHDTERFLNLAVKHVFSASLGENMDRYRRHKSVEVALRSSYISFFFSHRLLSTSNILSLLFMHSSPLLYAKSHQYYILCEAHFCAVAVPPCGVGQPMSILQVQLRQRLDLIQRSAPGQTDAPLPWRIYEPGTSRKPSQAPPATCRAASVSGTTPIRTPTRRRDFHPFLFYEANSFVFSSLFDN